MPEYIDRDEALAAIVEEEKGYDFDTRANFKIIKGGGLHEPNKGALVGILPEHCADVSGLSGPLPGAA